MNMKLARLIQALHVIRIAQSVAFTFLGVTQIQNLIGTTVHVALRIVSKTFSRNRNTD